MINPILTINVTLTPDGFAMNQQVDGHTGLNGVTNHLNGAVISPPTNGPAGASVTEIESEERLVGPEANNVPTALVDGDAFDTVDAPLSLAELEALEEDIGRADEPLSLDALAAL